jgi:hypothetical protein
MPEPRSDVVHLAGVTATLCGKVVDVETKLALLFVDKESRVEMFASEGFAQVVVLPMGAVSRLAQPVRWSVEPRTRVLRIHSRYLKKLPLRDLKRLFAFKIDDP